MHSRLAGLILVEVLVACLLVPAVIGGPVCTAAGLLVLGPIAAVALWDHLDTERRIRREWRDRHGGFEMAPPESKKENERGL
jgi:hypothetical protein